MKKRSLVITLAAFVVFTIVLVFCFLAENRRDEIFSDGDPLRERAMKAAVMGEELSSVARAQLDALPEEHQKEVGDLLDELDSKVTAVKKILTDPAAKATSLVSAVETLERTLEGILVVPDADSIHREGSPSP